MDTPSENEVAVAAGALESYREATAAIVELSQIFDPKMFADRVALLGQAAVALKAWENLAGAAKEELPLALVASALATPKPEVTVSPAAETPVPSGDAEMVATEDANIGESKVAAKAAAKRTAPQSAAQVQAIKDVADAISAKKRARKT